MIPRPDRRRGMPGRYRVGAVRLAAGSLVALCASQPQAAMEIRVAAQENSAPKFVALRRGNHLEVDGLCVGIMRAIERKVPEYRFVIDPDPQSLARIEAGLATGKLDAACGLLRTRERENMLHYIEPPLLALNFYIAVRADDEIDVRDWNDIRQLGDEGLVLGDLACAPVLRKVDGLLTDFSARDPKTNIQKLLAGRGRFFFYRSPGIENAIRAAGAQDKVRILPAVMARPSLYMVLSKSVPPGTADKIHKALSGLKANGELGRLLEEWSEN